MLRHTIRTLLRAPSFALATVAKTAIFSVVDGVLLLYSKSQKAREMGNSVWATLRGIEGYGQLEADVRHHD